MNINRLKRSVGLLAATAAVAVALPAGTALAGQCSYGGWSFERGDRIVSGDGFIYQCISVNNRMYWQYMGTAPTTGPWQP